MPEDITTPISKVLLKENDNLALIFPKKIAKSPEFELYFFRVMRRYPLHRIYDDLSEVAPEGTLDFNFLGEGGLGVGDNILTVWEERPFRILHFAVGVKPSDIWIYKAQPADVAQTGFAYKAPPKVGDERDFIPGELSPFESPTVATETILYYKASVQLGFKNNAAFTVKPVLRFLGAGYDCIPIVDDDFINKMLAGIKPVRYVTVGGLRYFDYTVPEEWKDNARIVDEMTIAEVMARR